MATCPRCAQTVEPSAKACPACGAALPRPNSETLSAVTADAPAPHAALPTPPPHSRATGGAGTGTGSGGAGGSAGPSFSTSFSSSIDSGRFAPGQVIAGRYRIISRLGKGGMGEVYRADDVTLAQPVALKFLPPEFAAQPDKVQRLLNEVRLTRQISHPNVCRVYDAVTLPPEFDAGAPTVFLAMEYIDGEDLSSLLRRIGRLPPDKALEVARQVCAGLAAAHDLGVIHRDIKPSNVMLDARGRARLTDFGVAGTAAEIIGSGTVLAGTPTYMAPEQLSGQSVSVRSDVYALGLLLYEVFTGKPVFQAASLAELRGLHATTQPPRPTTVVSDLDPLVERVILRCLEQDPAFRPASALAVSAALPGGDPLAAALAAGETPTPEMVAASGGTNALPPRFALTCLAAFALLVAGMVWIKHTTGLVARVPFTLSTEVLSAKASELLETLAPPGQPAPMVARGFFTNQQVLTDIAKRLESKDRWESLSTGRPTGVVFWYRRSTNPINPEFNAPRVWPYEPPLTRADDARVLLDTKGRLIQFDQIPRPRPRPVDPVAPRAEPPAPEPDWSKFFAAAGLDASVFKPADPLYGAEYATDVRRAWTGEWPMEGAFSPIPIRVEASSFDGRPVAFMIRAAWHTSAGAGARGGVAELGGMVDAAVFLFILAAGPFLAWRHLRTGRGDRRGAFRLAVFVFCTTLLYLVLPTFRPSTIFSTDRLTAHLARAVWMSAFAWTLYVALEPYIRRIAPWAVVGWTRLIAGRVIDPIVGRDVLVGAVLASGAGVVTLTAALIPGWLGAPPTPPLSPNWMWFGGPREALSTLMLGLSNAVFIPMYMTLLTVGLKWLLRKDLWTLIVLIVLGTILVAREFSFGPIGLVLGLLISVGYSIALLRYGLLALSATSITSFLLTSPPVIADAQAWFFPNWAFPYALAMGIVLTAAYASIGGRPGLAAWRLSRGPA